MQNTQEPLVDQKEVDHYFKKYNIENLKSWEPEILAKIVEFYKDYEAVCIPLKKKFMERVMKELEEKGIKLPG